MGDRTSANDYDDDMRRAKAAGIDAFALNLGADSWEASQIANAYLTFTEFRVNSREVAVFVPLVVSLRNMRRMPSTTLDPDIDEAAGRLEGEVGDKAAG